MKKTTDSAATPTIERFQTEGRHPHVQYGRQLDLSFATGSCRRPAYGRQQILRARAQHWFDIMRRMVDNAVEWKPAPPARPEQTALDLRHVTELAVKGA